MDAGRRSLGLDTAELKRWLKLYDLERYLFKEVSPRFRREQTLRPYDFFAIVVWKSNRAKTKIKRGLLDAGKTVQDLMCEVSQAETPGKKVGILLDVDGIGPAMASAILTVCYPEEFTVLDYRAWQVLEQAGIAGLPDDYPWDSESYLQYHDACRRLAEHIGLSLRDLDRALWAKSWEADLHKLVSGL